MTVDIDRLIHIQLAVVPPAKSMQQVVGVFGSETGKDDSPLVRPTIAIGVFKMNQLGTVHDITSAIPWHHTGRNQ